MTSQDLIVALAPVIHDAAAPDASAKTRDARRPGRSDEVNTHLLPLLRDPASGQSASALQAEVDATHPMDELSAAKGIVLCMAFSVPLWAIIGSVIWWLV